MENIRVMIVDDSTFSIAVLKRMLQKEGLEIVGTALNMNEAIQKAQELKPDLITMDIEMPKMDGIEATAIIKSKFPQIKIIMLTVFDNDENIFKAIKAGADGYFLKEVKTNQSILLFLLLQYEDLKYPSVSFN